MISFAAFPLTETHAKTPAVLVDELNAGRFEGAADRRVVYLRRLFDGNSSPFTGGLRAPARLRILSAFGRFARAARWLKYRAARRCGVGFVGPLSTSPN